MTFRKLGHRLFADAMLNVNGCRAQAQDPYQRIQQAILLGEEEDLVQQFASRLDVLQDMDESYVRSRLQTQRTLLTVSEL